MGRSRAARRHPPEYGPPDVRLHRLDHARSRNESGPHLGKSGLRLVARAHDPVRGGLAGRPIQRRMGPVSLGAAGVGEAPHVWRSAPRWMERRDLRPGPRSPGGLPPRRGRSVGAFAVGNAHVEPARDVRSAGPRHDVHRRVRFLGRPGSRFRWAERRQRPRHGNVGADARRPRLEPPARRPRGLRLQGLLRSQARPAPGRGRGHGRFRRPAVRAHAVGHAPMVLRRHDRNVPHRSRRVRNGLRSGARSRVRVRRLSVGSLHQRCVAVGPRGRYADLEPGHGRESAAAAKHPVRHLRRAARSLDRLRRPKPAGYLGAPDRRASGLVAARRSAPRAVPARRPQRDLGRATPAHGRVRRRGLGRSHHVRRAQPRSLRASDLVASRDHGAGAGRPGEPQRDPRPGA